MHQPLPSALHRDRFHQLGRVLEVLWRRHHHAHTLGHEARCQRRLRVSVPGGDAQVQYPHLCLRPDPEYALALSTRSSDDRW